MAAEEQDGLVLIRETQRQLNRLEAEILAAHSDLRVEAWSHSLGEASELDGWSVGLVFHGLKYQLELAVDFVELRQRPRVARVIAAWLAPPKIVGFVWFDIHGSKGFEECCHAVHGAVKLGVPTSPSFGATLTEVIRHFPEPEYRSSLTPDEQEVYECWIEEHRKLTPVPPHLVKQSDGFGLFPKNEEARVHLAHLLGTRPEAVSAVFPEALVPPELLGSSVVVVDLAWNVEDFRLWRRLYREKPLCSGLIYLSPIGFAGERAAMLIAKYTGSNLHETFEDESAATGVSLVTFEKVKGEWRMVETQPVSWKRVSRALYVGPLFLATYDWGELVDAELSGEPLQPILDLTWKLRSGGHQRLRVAPGKDGAEPDTLYVGIVSPGTVMEAVKGYFQISD